MKNRRVSTARGGGWRGVVTSPGGQLSQSSRIILTAGAVLFAVAWAPWAHDRAEATTLFWKTDGSSSSWTSSNWGTVATGPFTTGWTAGFDPSFTANSTITYVTNTNIGNLSIDPNKSVTVNQAGTLSTGGNVRTFTIGAGGTLTWQNQTISTAAGTGFIKNGAGTWDLTGESGAYLGGFTLNDGTMIVANNNALGGAASPLTINGGTIQSSGTRAYAPTGITLGGNFTNSGNGDATWAGTIALGAVTRTITNSTTGGSRIYTGVISGASGVGLTFNGAGTGVTYIGNVSNSYNGTVTIGGTAEVGFASSGALGAGTLIVIDGGRLTSSDTAGNAVTNANWGNTRTLQVSAATGTAISVKGATGDLIFDGAIVDKPSTTGAWAKQGAGTLHLGGVSSYSGATALNNGATQLTGGANRLPTTTVVSLGQTAATNLATLDLNGNNQELAGLNSITGTNATSGNNTVTSASAATLKLSGSGAYNYGDGTNANSGVITGALAVDIALGTGGVQTFGDVNTYSGGTTLHSGTLKLGNGNILADAGAVTVAGGTLDLQGNSETVGAVVLTSGSITGTGGATLTNGSVSNFDVRSGTISAKLGGSVGLDKTTAGAVTLSGASTYTGATSITAGTLNVTGSIASTSGVILSNSGSTLSTGASTSLGGTLSTGASTIVNPGGSGTVGALTLGALTSAGGSVFNFDFAGASSFDTISLNSGALNLSSGDVTLNLAGSGFLSGTHYYTLLSYGSKTGGGNFTLGTTPGGAYTFGLNNTGTNVILQVDSVTSNLVWSVGGAGPSITEGAGDWSDGGTNFYNSTLATPAAAWSNSATDDVTFGAGGNGGTVTLTGNVVAGGHLTFAAVTSPYTLGAVGGTHTLTVSSGIDANHSATINAPTILASSQTWAVASGQTLTVNGDVSEASAGKALTKDGTGTLILNGTSSYTGGTTVSQGTLQGTTSSLQGNIANSGSVVFDQSGTGTYAGQISGNGSVTKNGVGTVLFTGSNGYTGGTTVNSGTLQLGPGGILDNNSPVTLNGGALDLLSNDETVGAVVLAGGSIIGSGTLTGSAFDVRSGTISAKLGGSGAVLTKSTAGTVTLSANNSYSGGTVINGGILVVDGGNNRLGSTSTSITFAGGTLRTDTSGITAARPLIVNTGGGTFDSNGFDSSTSGASTINDTLTKNGAGKLALNGTVTFGAGGALAINAGAVSLGQAGGTTINMANGSVIDGDLNLVNAVRLNFNGGVFSGTGHINLATTQTSLSVAGGSVPTTATVAAAVVLNSGNLGGAFTSYLGSTQTTGAGSQPANSVTFNGVISGTSDVNFSNGGSGGAGVVVLGAHNSWTGTTLINNAANGVVRLAITDSLPTATALTFGSGSQNVGVFDMAGYDQTLASLASNTSGTVKGIANTGGSLSTLTLNGSASTTFKGVIGVQTDDLVYPRLAGQNNNIKLVRGGTGTTILTGTNTYTGGTSITGGVLQVDTVASLPTTGAIVVSGGGELILNAGATFGGVSQSLSLSGTGPTATSGALRSGSGLATHYQGPVSLDGDAVINAAGVTGELTLDGDVSGSATLQKQGAGTLILAATGNTHTGPTRVGNGTLSVNAGSSMGTGNLTMAQTAGNNTAVILNNTAQTIGNLESQWTDTTGTHSQTLTLNGVTLTIHQNGTTTFGDGSIPTLTASITGNGGVTLAGDSTGTLVLTGTNSYIGPTVLNGGTLKVEGSLDPASVMTINGGVLQGSGHVGAVNLAAGGTESPGSSPGTLNQGNTVWTGAGNYNWQLLDAAGSTPGSDWDLLNITGTLNVAAASGFMINLWSLSSIGPDVNGDAQNWDNTIARSWVLATTTGGISGFLATNFNIITSPNNGTAGFSNPQGAGSFSLILGNSNHDLLLHFSPGVVPEPASALLLLIGGLLVLPGRNRKYVTGETR